MNSEQFTIPYNFTPRDYQLELFRALDGEKGKPETKKLRAYLLWHRRCGKDLTSWSYMVKEAWLNKGIYYYLLPEYAEAQRIIWEGIDSGITHDGKKTETISFLDRIPNRSVTVKESQKDLKVTFLHNGSVIRLIGTNNYDAIRGTNPRGVVMSEYDYQDPGAWEVLSPILEANGGWAIFNSTPADTDTGNMERLEERIKNSKGWFIDKRQTMWPDRPNYTGMLTEKHLERIQEENGFSDDYMEREYGVSFTASAKGSFYGHLLDIAERQGRVGHFPHINHGAVDVFMDIGLDMTSMWFRQMQQGRPVMIDYFESEDMAIMDEEGFLNEMDVITVLKDREYNYRDIMLPWDGNTRSKHTKWTYEDILQKGLEGANIDANIIINDKIDVSVGIAEVRSRFRNYFFHEVTTEVGRRHLRKYHKRYDKINNRFTDIPVHDNASHCADALRCEATAEAWVDPFWNKEDKNKPLYGFDVLDI